MKRQFPVVTDNRRHGLVRVCAVPCCHLAGR